MGCTPSYAVSNIEDKEYQGHTENDLRVNLNVYNEPMTNDPPFEKDVQSRGAGTWSLLRSVKPRRDRNRDRLVVSLKMDRTVLVDAFVKMIISDGQPFEIVSESGMKMLVGPLLEALDVSLDEDVLRQEVVERARKIRDGICSDVLGRLVSLKVDVVCRGSRPFVGISVCYLKDGVKRLRVLGVREVSTAHSGHELRGIIWRLLSDYGITKHQVYTVTVNNGGNPLKAFTKTNNGRENRANETDGETNEEEEEANDSKGEKEAAIAVSMSVRDAFVAEKETESDNPLATNIDSLENTIHSMAHSAIHTHADSKKLVEKARVLSNKLRTKTVMAILKSKGTKLAIVDCQSRWKSTYAMVIRLHNNELRKVINEMGALNPDFKISKTEWDKMERLIQAFKPLDTFSARVSQPDLTIGDFFIDWLKLKMEVKKIDSEFARNVGDQMKRAEEKMLKNKAFLSAVYLDPRIRIALSLDQTEKARKHIERVWKSVCRVKGIRTETQTPESVEAETGTPSTEDDLEIFLRSKDRNILHIKSSVCSLSTHFKFYEDSPREKPSTNVVQFWDSFDQARPELHQLAMIVLACPINGAGIERIWSGVKFLLNPSHVKLSENILDDVMLINTNQPIN